MTMLTQEEKLKRALVATFRILPKALGVVVRVLPRLFLALPFLLTCIIATLEDVIFLYFVFALLPGIRWWCFFFIRVLSDLFFYLSTSTLFGSFDATRKKVTSDICRLRACARVYK